MGTIDELTGQNRIEKMIDAQKAEIQRRLDEGIVTQERVDETDRALDMPVDEFVSFQNLKSLAVANGEMTADEGMTVYNALGESPEHFNAQPVEVKAILTKLHAELLGRQIRRRTSA